MSSRDLKQILGKYYHKNNTRTYDLYLGDIYNGTEWRDKLEYRFLKELDRRISSDGLNEEAVRKASRSALKYISRKLKDAIECANQKAIKEGKEATFSRLASKNEIVAKQLSETVGENLQLLNLDLLKDIAKELGIIVSLKNKQEICSDISTKLTKPVKVTKELHRGKWKPLSSDSGDYDELIRSYYASEDQKLSSSQYTILRICGSVAQTLYTDLDTATIINIANNFRIESTHDKKYLCRIITKILCEMRM